MNCILVFLRLCYLTRSETVEQENDEDDDGEHRDIHEEHLGVKSVSFEIHNLNGLIEDGVEEKVALSIPLKDKIQS